jgi:gliding motility-associated protein GldM
MSIPKEPRQLMINLMYLVLTALLALNVSAEIINAFFAINKSISTSNEIVDRSNLGAKGGIDEQVKAYNNPANQGLQAKAEQAIEISKDFEAYVKGLNDLMVKEAGGVDSHYKDGRPVRYKDKDVTTRLFINGGKGAELEKKITETRNKLLALFTGEELEAMKAQMPLAVDSISSDSKYKTWPEYKFKQMPVAAIMPFFTKLIGDAKTSQAAVLNKVLEMTKGKPIVMDNFKVAIAPKNGYVIKGEKFEADVYLAAYSSNPGTGISISVNGQGLGLKEGVGHYETTANNLGKQTVKATASIKNPFTGQTTQAVGEFSYEVGQRSAALSADKMNVVYIGVENPISIAVAGANSNEVRLSATGCTVSGSGTKYTATANREGPAEFTVSAPGITQKFPFRVKRIPDPVPVLGAGPNKRGGSMNDGEFKAQRGLAAILENFDFDARCNIQSYEIVHVPKRQDPVPNKNEGGTYNERSVRMASAAKPGDVYYFNDIKARCPGDAAGRNLGSMAFSIR